MYEEKGVIKEPIFKDFVIEATTFPNVTDLLQSPKYNIDGYRRVGIKETVEISKQTAESLVMQKDTPPI